MNFYINTNTLQIQNYDKLDFFVILLYNKEQSFYFLYKISKAYNYVRYFVVQIND